MNSYLISSFYKIWLTTEKVSDEEYRIYFVDCENRKVNIPYGLEIYNDHCGRFMEKINYYYSLNANNNHTIYLNETHCCFNINELNIQIIIKIKKRTIK